MAPEGPQPPPSRGDGPRTALIINNNPGGSPGKYTQLLIDHLLAAGLRVVEARDVQAVDAYADTAFRGGDVDVGLIVTCGSPVVLTEPVDAALHVTKTTAAMLHFPNAPVVGICFGMQLLAQLYGGALVEMRDSGHAPGIGCWHELRRLDVRSRMLDACEDAFVQWCSNFIFVEQLPPRFFATAADSSGRVMAMEHVNENVYGVQFHPEVLKDGDNPVIDAIIGLVGQNRRIKPQQLLPGGGGCAWHCSAGCRLRQAVKDATREVPKPGGCISPSTEPTLSRRLGAAKRQALADLKRDHCQAGGITVAALEDAVSTLRQIGSASASGGTQAQPETDEARPAPLATHCSPHEADLRLRAAVKELLAGGGPRLGAPSGRASTGTTCSGSCASSTPRALPRGVAAAAGGGLGLHEASGARQSDPLLERPLVRVTPCRGSLPACSREADLRLRRAVSEALAAAAAARGGGPRASGEAQPQAPGGGPLAAALAGARRGAMAALRRGARGSLGSVELAALEDAVASIHAAAAAAETATCAV